MSKALVLLAFVVALAGCATPDAARPATPPITATTTPPAVVGCPLARARCPDPTVTPGAVIPSQVGVCSVAYNPRRNLTDSAKARVLARYHLPPDAPVAEWDHLVARWAGGTSTSSNVWPQVNQADKTRKDVLEGRLYQAVCRHAHAGRDPSMVAQACPGGTLDLACARAILREFWRWW